MAITDIGIKIKFLNKMITTLSDAVTSCLIIFYSYNSLFANISGYT